MAMDAEHVTDSGNNNTPGEQQPQPSRKRFLTIRPNIALPFLASLFPCLRHRATYTANTAPPATSTAPAPEAPAPAPAPAATPETPVQTPSNSDNVLMSVEDFSRFVDAAEDLLKPVPQLWQRFIDLLESFLPPSPAAAEG